MVPWFSSLFGEHCNFVCNITLTPPSLTHTYTQGPTTDECKDEAKTADSWSSSFLSIHDHFNSTYTIYDLEKRSCSMEGTAAAPGKGKINNKRCHYLYIKHLAHRASSSKENNFSALTLHCTMATHLASVLGQTRLLYNLKGWG